MRGHLVAPIAGAVVLWSVSIAVAAHDADVRLPDIEVSGQYENGVGTSDSASQGVVTQKVFENHPVMRPGEVLESVPGLIISQHSGDGKANQYYLRGYNLDHGTDFATWLAGMPVNMRTHAHGQGYTDLNILIPELISRVDYHKGPYFAEDGDFGSAGSARLSYADRLPGSKASVTAGTQGYRRALLLGSPEAGSGRVVYGLDYTGNDGPWVHSTDLRKFNGVLRYARGDGNDGFNVTAMAYDAKWNSTDQVPLGLVNAGGLDRFGAVDPTDGGRSSRYSLSTEWRRVGDGERSQASAYIIHSTLHLFSNFTYYLDSPAQGDQFEQAESRTLFGGEASHTWFGRLGEREMSNTLGVQLRRDRLAPVGLYGTVGQIRTPKSTLFQGDGGGLLDAAGNPLLDGAGNPVANPGDPRAVTYTSPAVIREDRVTESSAAIYLQNQVQWAEKFRSIAGLRSDFYTFKVDSSMAANSGDRNANLTSPKLSLIFGPWARTELFLNYGRGFHSNDARGVTTTIDPRSCAQPTGCQPVAGVTPLVRTSGYEVGTRSQWLSQVTSSLSLWRLKQDSELLFTGDAGTTEPSRPSVRTGVEWDLHWTPRPWLWVELNYAVTRARFDDADSAGVGDRIPGALESAATVSVTVDNHEGWFGSLGWRYFGPRPLIEDDSVRSRSTTTTSLRIGNHVTPQTSVTLDVFNLFDRAGSDVDYYYLSRVAPAALAASDIHFHPIEKRAFRLTLTQRF